MLLEEQSFAQMFVQSLRVWVVVVMLMVAIAWDDSAVWALRGEQLCAGLRTETLQVQVAAACRQEVWARNPSLALAQN